ncbi:glycosyltransferase [Gottfriedia sp. S16(2024)]|uniref:glycosyltransferase family 2 protein n=1 Tax=Gottfriedia sp. S16(2024) TaxID=3162883 RepID=UPI003D24537E
MEKLGNVLVSVIIPTFNREKLINRTIESVLSQTYTNFEVIIVDDASTDNTEKVIKGFRDERIKYIRLEENSRGTKPRNIGILESKGELIALLDSDDVWLPNKLEKQIEFIKDDIGNDFMCFTDVILKADNSKEVKSRNREIIEGEDILEYIILEDNSVQTSTYLLSASLAKKTLFGYDVKKHQDWDFCLKLQKQNTKFISLQEALSIYYVDKREGRIAINSKYQVSLQWLEKVKMYMSNKTYHAFLAKYVANSIIIEGNRLQGFKIFAQAYAEKAINQKMFLKGLVKCALPNFLIKRLL